MSSKQDIRSAITARRKALDPGWLESTSREVSNNLQTLGAFRTAKFVALYMAVGGEVNLETLFHACWKLGKRTCIPVFNTGTKLYEMAEISKDTTCRKSRYGILEPVSPTLVPVDQIDLMAVPGVAFDPSGNRLGRGGGYFDRLLEEFRGCTAAVAFDFQILPDIPVEAHDRPVQYIVTETKIFNL